jgi:DUF2905 family protein
MPRTRIIAGVVIVPVGVMWPWIKRLGLGRLPRDVFVQQERVHNLRARHDRHSREHSSVTDLVAFFEIKAEAAEA